MVNVNLQFRIGKKEFLTVKTYCEQNYEIGLNNTDFVNMKLFEFAERQLLDKNQDRAAVPDWGKKQNYYRLRAIVPMKRYTVMLKQLRVRYPEFFKDQFGRKNDFLAHLGYVSVAEKNLQSSNN